ncbi:MAG: hypothetical protein IJW63_11025 [Lachnospiraceae bacterium]|nr:hypothetical protein [Lachnospiraceae bacterium]
MQEIQKINQQYLRILLQGENETGEEKYYRQVLQRNDIKGLLPFSRRSIDGQDFCYYSIEGLHCMEEVFEGTHFSKEDMDSFVRCLDEVIEEVKGFLLRQEQLCLSPTYIMFDGVLKRWQFLYLIDTHNQQGQDLVELLDFFLSKLGSDLEKESWFYEYYTEVLQFGDNISPTELVRMWEKEVETEAKERENVPQEKETDVLCLLQQEETACEKPKKLTWKERVNEIVYAGLYLVPFLPDH